MPVVASIAQDAVGNVMNVNADTLASSVASAFKAEKLIFLTNVPGVFNKNKKIIKEIKTKDVDVLIKSKAITGGMIQKLKDVLSR